MTQPELYTYCGPGNGQGEVHAVVLHDPHADEIITVAGLNIGKPQHSWIGGLKEFQRCFREF